MLQALACKSLAYKFFLLRFIPCKVEQPLQDRVTRKWNCQQMQLSEDLHLIEKTLNHTVNQKKSHISVGDQQLY